MLRPRFLLGSLFSAILNKKTITPGTSDQVIPAGTFCAGPITVAGDADLVAGNIKKDINIFGVVGTYEGAGGIVFSGAEQTVNEPGDPGIDIKYKISDDGKHYLINSCFNSDNRRLPVRGTSVEWNRICTLLGKTFVSAIIIGDGTTWATSYAPNLSYYVSGYQWRTVTSTTGQPILAIIKVA